jgi:predicted homoserine dehydrogenase-like protein
MNLHRLAQHRAASGRPVQVALVGAGKFGSMFLAQVPIATGAVPIGLAHRVELTRDVAAGEIVRWLDVKIPESEAYRARRDMECRFPPRPVAIAAQ